MSLIHIHVNMLGYVCTNGSRVYIYTHIHMYAWICMYKWVSYIYIYIHMHTQGHACIKSIMSTGKQGRPLRCPSLEVLFTESEWTGHLGSSPEKDGAKLTTPPPQTSVCPGPSSWRFSSYLFVLISSVIAPWPSKSSVWLWAMFCDPAFGPYL